MECFAADFLRVFNENVKIWFLGVRLGTTFVFILCQVEGYQNKLEQSCRPVAFTSKKAFLKTKKSSASSLSATFSACFLNKNYFVIFYELIKVYCLAAFTS